MQLIQSAGVQLLWQLCRIAKAVMGKLTCQRWLAPPSIETLNPKRRWTCQAWQSLPSLYTLTSVAKHHACHDRMACWAWQNGVPSLAKFGKASKQWLKFTAEYETEQVSLQAAGSQVLLARIITGESTWLATKQVDEVLLREMPRQSCNLVIKKAGQQSKLWILLG